LISELYYRSFDIFAGKCKSKEKVSEWLRDLDKVENAAECSYFSNASISPLPVETFDGASGSLNVIIHQDTTASATEATEIYQVSIWVLISNTRPGSNWTRMHRLIFERPESCSASFFEIPNVIEIAFAAVR